MEVSSDGHSSSATPKLFMLGVGCERGTGKAEMDELVAEVLKRAGVSPHEIKAVASIEKRRYEPAVCWLADRLARPLLTFSAQRLEEETPRLIHPSDLVFAHVGCHGVAEAAALAAAGKDGKLVIAKTKSAHATAALASTQ
ncbi:cobalamin biosynthesis protein [Oryzifoliimicrobium ureilyticus]|uniref:cobalamin biosynthesis protein n=1 Tax=Oryzifoliimicrobium ureilyticus TaxID=3113724 RepID=UPI0030765E51